MSFLFLFLLVVPPEVFSQQSHPWEEEVLLDFQEQRSEPATDFLNAVSSTTDYVGISVPVVVFATGWITKDKAIRQKGLYIAKSVVVSTVLVTALKHSINRNRPFDENPMIVPVGSAGSHSFPSGHSSLSFTTATALSLSFPKWYVIVPAYLWAGTVSVSRIYLGVHYPSDVVTGAVLGTVSAWATHKANDWLKGKRKKKEDAKTVLLY